MMDKYGKRPQYIAPESSSLQPVCYPPENVVSDCEISDHEKTTVTKDYDDGDDNDEGTEMKLKNIQTTKPFLLDVIELRDNCKTAFYSYVLTTYDKVLYKNKNCALCNLENNETFNSVSSSDSGIKQNLEFSLLVKFDQEGQMHLRYNDRSIQKNDDHSWKTLFCDSVGAGDKIGEPKEICKFTSCSPNFRIKNGKFLYIQKAML